MRIDDLDGRRALLAASGLRKGRILDVGMGACGCMSFFLAKRGFEVVGIDRSARAVRAATKEAARRRLKRRFTARWGGAVRMPFEDGTFDAVCAYHALHHADHVKRTIAEMFRVCKEGGLVLIADLHEAGRKDYHHKHNATRLLARILRLVRQHTDHVRLLDSKYDSLFICTNEEGKGVYTNQRGAAGRKKPQ